MSASAFAQSRPAVRTLNVRGGVVRWLTDPDETNLRAELARVVAALAGWSAPEVEIVSRRGLKPSVVLAGRPSAEWHVSLSYTQHCAAAALSRHCAVGFDLEWIDPDFAWEPVAAEFFTSEEVKRWTHQPPDIARRSFFRAWVRWEAALKCRGTGFDRALLAPEIASRGMTFFDVDTGSDSIGSIAMRESACVETSIS